MNELVKTPNRKKVYDFAKGKSDSLGISLSKLSSIIGTSEHYLNTFCSKQRTNDISEEKAQHIIGRIGDVSKVDVDSFMSIQPKKIIVEQQLKREVDFLRSEIARLKREISLQSKLIKQLEKNQTV